MRRECTGREIKGESALGFWPGEREERSAAGGRGRPAAGPAGPRGEGETDFGPREREESWAGPRRGRKGRGEREGPRGMEEILSAGFGPTRRRDLFLDSPF